MASTADNQIDRQRDQEIDELVKLSAVWSIFTKGAKQSSGGAQPQEVTEEEIALSKKENTRKKGIRKRTSHGKFEAQGSMASLSQGSTGRVSPKLKMLAKGVTAMKSATQHLAENSLHEDLVSELATAGRNAITERGKLKTLLSKTKEVESDIALLEKKNLKMRVEKDKQTGQYMRALQQQGKIAEIKDWAKMHNRLMADDRRDTHENWIEACANVVSFRKNLKNSLQDSRNTLEMERNISRAQMLNMKADDKRKKNFERDEDFLLHLNKLQQRLEHAEQLTRDVEKSHGRKPRKKRRKKKATTKDIEWVDTQFEEAEAGQDNPQSPSPNEVTEQPKEPNPKMIKDEKHETLEGEVEIVKLENGEPIIRKVENQASTSHGQASAVPEEQGQQQPPPISSEAASAPNENEQFPQPSKLSDRPSTSPPIVRLPPPDLAPLEFIKTHMHKLTPEERRRNMLDISAKLKEENAVRKKLQVELALQVKAKAVQKKKMWEQEKMSEINKERQEMMRIQRIQVESSKHLEREMLNRARFKNFKEKHYRRQAVSERTEELSNERDRFNQEVANLTRKTINQTQKLREDLREGKLEAISRKKQDIRDFAEYCKLVDRTAMKERAEMDLHMKEVHMSVVASRSNIPTRVQMCNTPEFKEEITHLIADQQAELNRLHHLKMDLQNEHARLDTELRSATHKTSLAQERLAELSNKRLQRERKRSDHAGSVRLETSLENVKPKEVVAQVSSLDVFQAGDQSVFRSMSVTKHESTDKRRKSRSGRAGRASVVSQSLD